MVSLDGQVVVAEQQVGAVALRFRAPQHVGQVGTWPRQDVPRPPGDLRRGETARDALDQEQFDVLAGHVASSKVSSLSR